MPSRKRRYRRDDDVVRTEPDIKRRADGSELDDFEATPEEITTSAPRPRSVPGRATITDVDSKDTFPFLKLPLEIRNMIYKCLVVSKNTIRLDTRLYHWHAPYRTCLKVLIINKMIYNEAIEIFYHENKFAASYGMYEHGVLERRKVSSTQNATSRNLRSGRSVDMVKHTGLIWPETLQRLCHVNFDIILLNRSWAYGDHATLHWTHMMQHALHPLFHSLLDRWAKGTETIRGKEWIITVYSSNGKLSNLIIEKALEPLLTEPVQSLVREGKLTLRIEGGMPVNWESIFWMFRGEKGFEPNVPEAPVAPIYVDKSLIPLYFKGVHKNHCWRDVLL